ADRWDRRGESRGERLLQARPGLEVSADRRPRRALRTGMGQGRISLTIISADGHLGGSRAADLPARQQRGLQRAASANHRWPRRKEERGFQGAGERDAVKCKGGRRVKHAGA
ncbi:hypothetical protein NDU88_004211, partial [Pleurodeles waltl]